MSEPHLDALARWEDSCFEWDEQREQEEQDFYEEMQDAIIEFAKFLYHMRNSKFRFSEEAIDIVLDAMTKRGECFFSDDYPACETIDDFERDDLFKGHVEDALKAIHEKEKAKLRATLEGGLSHEKDNR